MSLSTWGKSTIWLQHSWQLLGSSDCHGYPGLSQATALLNVAACDLQQPNALSPDDTRVVSIPSEELPRDLHPLVVILQYIRFCPTNNETHTHMNMIKQTLDGYVNLLASCFSRFHEIKCCCIACGPLAQRPIAFCTLNVAQYWNFSHTFFAAAPSLALGPSGGNLQSVKGVQERPQEKLWP